MTAADGLGATSSTAHHTIAVIGCIQ